MKLPTWVHRRGRELAAEVAKSSGFDTFQSPDDEEHGVFILRDANASYGRSQGLVAIVPIAYLKALEEK
jgi:hypothetical protein